jgi:hypothetical protein
MVTRLPYSARPSRIREVGPPRPSSRPVDDRHVSVIAGTVSKRLPHGRQDRVDPPPRAEAARRRPFDGTGGLPISYSGNGLFLPTEVG